MKNHQLISYLKNASIIIYSILLIVLPSFFLTNTTNIFVLPKQLLIISSSMILLVLWSLRMMLEKKISLQVNPFNLAIGVFGLVVFLSSLLSVNRYDSLFQAIPLVGIIILYFLYINSIEDKKAFKTTFYSFVLGGVLAGIISILYGFKVYFFPISQIQTQYFNPFGSVVQSIMYFATIFLVLLLNLISKAKTKLEVNSENIFYALSGVIFVLAIGVAIYQIFSSPQIVVLLPFVYGLQISFAAISQNSQRFIQSLLLGSGYGTFAIDFSLFKLASFNQEPKLWSISFPYSSSYALELLATTGLVGALSYIFLLFKLIRTKVSKKSILYVGIFALALVSFLLPFSVSVLFLFFMLIGIYSAKLYLEDDKRFYTVDLKLVTLKRGLFALAEDKNFRYDSPAEKRANIMLPTVLFIISSIIVLFVGYFTFKLVQADMAFAQSLLAQNQSDGQKVYNLQRSAILNFPQRSDFHRVFSQVNLALANSVSNSITQGSSPSAEVQQTIVSLLQQSINSGRNAITLAPGSAANWENLSQVYRSLIGISQNADQFAIASLQQAILLDPYNPQLYIELGGIYYQLKQYDAAQNQFQVAVNLKPDLANAYYNLGHSLESKGDLTQALAAYQAVEQLTREDKESNDKIKAEISALQAKVGSAGAAAQSTAPQSPTTAQPPLELNTPSTEINPGTQVDVAPPPSTTPTPEQ